MKLRGPAWAIGCMALVATAGCSSDTKKDISQSVARNAVAVGMKKEFSDHDHSLKGLPTCTTNPVAGSNTKVNVACTATTDDGGKASLIGRTDGANEVRGTFTGYVDGTKIFTVDCIGC